MISGHGANLIFFDKNIKIGRPEHSLHLTPLPLSLHPTTSYFCLTHHPTPLKMDVIYVSPLSSTGSIVKEELGNKTVNYGTKAKTYLLC